MKKNNPLFKHFFFAVLFFPLIFHQNLFAQNQAGHIVEGIVSNEKGEPIQGAVIHEQNTNENVVTDASGKFQLQSQGQAPFWLSLIQAIQKNLFRLLPSQAL